MDFYHGKTKFLIKTPSGLTDKHEGDRAIQTTKGNTLLLIRQGMNAVAIFTMKI